MTVNRREFIGRGAAGAAAITFGPAFIKEALAAPARAGASPYGALAAADANTVALPAGFTSRVIARSNLPVGPSTYMLPIFPDGQATYRTADGGWVLVTNSESLSQLGAGASGTRFGPDGSIKSAYRILGGTDVNCAGGPTPWGTWLSGEEGADGMIWECDPAGVLPAEARPALGVFPHEAACVDPVEGRVYLTEDVFNAAFYRFTPDDYPDLSSGTLEVAILDESMNVTWARVPDPTTAQTGTPTRQQVPESYKFANCEGIWYSRGVAYFTSKVDKKVWAYDIRAGKMDILFDRELALDSSLDAVDNVTVTPTDDVLVCEDGGNMEIGIITSDRQVAPLIRFEGSEHDNSELCGVAFSPDGKRLYVTSQRANGVGAIYEISGPFKQPKGGVPDGFTYGPPAGDVRPNGPLNPGGDRKKPKAKIKAKKKLKRDKFLRKGLKVEVSINEPGRVAVQLDSPDLATTPGKGGSSPRPKNTVLGRGEAIAELNTKTVEVLIPKPKGKAKKLLNKNKDAIKVRVLVSAVDASDNEATATKNLKLSGK